MKIPSFARHSGTTTARDDNRDGVADPRQMRTGPADEPTTQRIRYGRDDTRDDLPPVPRDHSAAVPDRHSEPTDRTPPPPPGPRPRASLLATLSLILGVAAALIVLTGVLAGYGIAVGALAVLLAIGGIRATRRRHVAGKSDALLGLLLGLGAIVLGVLALSEVLPWLGPDTETVTPLRNWLDAQFVDRF